MIRLVSIEAVHTGIINKNLKQNKIIYDKVGYV